MVIIIEQSVNSFFFSQITDCCNSDKMEKIGINELFSNNLVYFSVLFKV